MGDRVGKGPRGANSWKGRRNAGKRPKIKTSSPPVQSSASRSPGFTDNGDEELSASVRQQIDRYTYLAVAASTLKEISVPSAVAMAIANGKAQGSTSTAHIQDPSSKLKVLAFWGSLSGIAIAMVVNVTMAPISREILQKSKKADDTRLAQGAVQRASEARRNATTDKELEIMAAQFVEHRQAVHQLRTSLHGTLSGTLSMLASLGSAAAASESKGQMIGSFGCFCLALALMTGHVWMQSRTRLGIKVESTVRSTVAEAGMLHSSGSLTRVHQWIKEGPLNADSFLSAADAGQITTDASHVNWKLAAMPFVLASSATIGVLFDIYNEEKAIIQASRNVAAAAAGYLGAASGLQLAIESMADLLHAHPKSP